MIKVNGKEYDIMEIALPDLLKEHGYTATHVAVECNEKIVPRAEHESFVVKDGDVVEVVSLVGGG